MARTGKDQGTESDAEERPITNTFDAIHEIAKYNARASLESEHQLLLWLQSWWSRLYNRPLKDPLLQTYSVEELLYEFYDRQERQAALDEGAMEDADRIEERKVKDNLDWAEEEERKELEALKKKQEAAKTEPDPSSPDNEKWMQDQIDKELAEGRKLYGDDFGEDIEG